MSTGKRLAKRSIIGTRVCAPGENGKFYAGVIHAVKTPASENNNCINLTVNTRYSVRFDSKLAVGKRACKEYRECELIGPGFGSVTSLKLASGQKVFITYNGRETSGEVMQHDVDLDEVVISISPPGQEMDVEVTKRLDEVRLLESRKSARLMDQDTDFARLADMAGVERKRQQQQQMSLAQSHNIDVPLHHQHHQFVNCGSRKRRPSGSSNGTQMDASLIEQSTPLPMHHHPQYREADPDDDLMDECNAALVLMSLSCSPQSSSSSSVHFNLHGTGDRSPGEGSSSSASWRSGTPSPPLSEEGSVVAYWRNQSCASDEGIVVDYVEEFPRKKKANCTVFQCTWRGCSHRTLTHSDIENHVRSQHLGPRKSSTTDDLSDHEEEFYYNEVELIEPHSSPPTMSHQDMARPPHEDPEYQRQLVGSIRLGLGLGNHATHTAAPITIPSTSSGHYIQHSHHSSSYSAPMKHHRLSPRPASAFPYPSPSSPPALLSLSAPNRALPSSPSRRLRGENKKCRKVYGMEHRELWCTQCKWKKACSRFGD